MNFKLYNIIVKVKIAFVDIYFSVGMISVFWYSMADSETDSSS